MSVDPKEDGTVHLEADHVNTVVLGLCCLEMLWTNHPDVVRSIAKTMGDPALAAHGPRARELLRILLKKGRG